MRILVTAFEAFGSHSKNPTMDILASLPEKIGKVKIYKQLLPVSYARSFASLRQKLMEKSFDYILLMGLHGSASHILLEMAAHNHQDTEKPDNDNFVPTHSAIDPKGKLAYQSEMPYWELLESLTKAGFPVEPSSSAGTYLCNYTYYKCQEFIENNYRSSQCLFVHVPPTPDMNENKSLPLETECKAIEHLLEFLANHSRIFKSLQWND